MLSLPNSLWAATARPPPRTPALVGRLRADVVVVGAGFTGLSAALHLAKAGARVVVLEAMEPGWGASGRNGGQVIPGLRAEQRVVRKRLGTDVADRLIEFAGTSARFLFDLVDEHGLRCEAENCGWIQAAQARGALGNLEARAEEWRSRGVDIETLDAARTASLLGTRWYCGALLDPRGGSVQPLSYARELARAAQKLGAAIHGRSLVKGFEPSSPGWRVRTDRGEVMAGQVIVCTNAYTDLSTLGGHATGLSRSVIPVFSVQVATRPLTDNLRSTILPEGHVVADSRRLTTYFRLDTKGRLVVGGRGGQHEPTRVEHYEPVVKRLRELFHQVSDIELDFFWGGRVALTMDGLPHLHELAPGVLAALGYNGRGVAMATLMGSVLAARCLGADPKDIAFPTTRLRPIALHGLRKPALGSAVWWKDLRDTLEHR